MKLKNVVKGARIQAKRDTTGDFGRVVHKGTVLEVTDILRPDSYDPYRVRVDGDSLDGGCAWVDPADFRKVKEVAVEEVTEAPTEHVYKVGDKVLVGSMGAGYGILEPRYADLVCEVVGLNTNTCGDPLIRIHNACVPLKSGYYTRHEYISPYVEPEPVQEFQEGDVLLCTTACEGRYQEKCIKGRLYKYLTESKHYSGRVHVQDPELHSGQASVFPENFTLYARKVEDDAAL